MSRYHSYLNSAVKILSVYEGKEPFAAFLKKFFSENKKYGSKDRKQISHLCYSYFRPGRSASHLSVEEKIVTALFLCSNEPNEILREVKPDWNEQVGRTLQDKLAVTGVQLSSVFPWKDELSDGLDHEKFASSFFIQPDLFLRARPGHIDKVLKKLDDDQVVYEFMPPSSIRLANSFKADAYFELDKEVVIQDLSSQRIGEFIPVRPAYRTGKPRRSDRVWDCCAGSGGKSIMLYDLDPSVELTVSDVRESILINLKKRFQTAGIKKYTSFIGDLAHSRFTIHDSFGRHRLAEGAARFDLIIADVPCTGSGTWSRTPEQLAFFDEKKIEEYAALQKKIVTNIIPQLEPGAHFLYCTCSVFRKENEEMVEFIKEKFHLEVTKMELIKGYEMKADSMFAVLFQKLL